MDDVIIAAATGTAFTGETGATSESAQTPIAAGGTGLTIAKLRTLLKHQSLLVVLV
jgi:hypothetical protein